VLLLLVKPVERADANREKEDKGLLKLPFLLFFLPPITFTEERLHPRNMESVGFPDAGDVPLDAEDANINLFPIH
jgi:hypothetical protein